MPLNSDALQDVRIELNRARQEIAQLKHANGALQTEVQRLKAENAKLQKPSESSTQRYSSRRMTADE